MSCASSATGEPESVGGDPLTDRIWLQAEANRPGVIRAFLSNGTLLMDSCWETFRVAVTLDGKEYQGCGRAP